MVGHVGVIGEGRCVGIERRTALNAEIGLVIAENLLADISHAVSEIDSVGGQVRRALSLPARIAKFTELASVEGLVCDVGEVVPLDHVGQQAAQAQIEAERMLLAEEKDAQAARLAREKSAVQREKKAAQAVAKKAAVAVT